MNKDNFYKAKELKNTQYNLDLLKKYMINNSWFGIKFRKTFFEDDYSKISFKEFDEETLRQIRQVLSDFCDRRSAEIDAEFEKL